MFVIPCVPVGFPATMCMTDAVFMSLSMWYVRVCGKVLAGAYTVILMLLAWSECSTFMCLTLRLREFVRQFRVFDMPPMTSEVGFPVGALSSGKLLIPTMSALLSVRTLSAVCCLLSIKVSLVPPWQCYGSLGVL